MGLLIATQGMHLRTEIENGDKTKDDADVKAKAEATGIGKNGFKK